MTTEVNNNSYLDSLSIDNKKNAEAGSNELGKNEFLELMVAQLNNQDPLSPQENGEFIAQLAQFSSVESLDNLNNQFEAFSNNFFSNQAMEASSLVGRSVTIETDTALYQQGSVISGSVEVPASTGDTKITIFDENNEIVETLNLGPQPAGEMVFRWDGANFELNGEVVKLGEEGDVLPEWGNYRFVAEAQIDGKNEQLGMALSANVNSVTVNGDQGLILNLAGYGAVSINDVVQFN